MRTTKSPRSSRPGKLNVDEASRLFHDAREHHADFLVDTEQRTHDRREHILMAIGTWYTHLNYSIPLAMKAETKSVSSATEGNIGSYQADFLGPEFTARVESYVRFDLDEHDVLHFIPVAPHGYELPPLAPGELSLHVSIFPYANLHSIGSSEFAAGSAAGTYRMDEHGNPDITGEHVLEILKQATTAALSHE